MKYFVLIVMLLGPLATSGKIFAQSAFRQSELVLGRTVLQREIETEFKKSTEMTFYPINFARVIECHFDSDSGGYDDETISLLVEEKATVSSIFYESYQGSVGPFTKVYDRFFAHTTDQLIIEYVATIKADLSLVELGVYYKDSGERLNDSKEFVCGELKGTDF